MNTFQQLRDSEEFEQLRTVSTKLGHNPLQIQGPGGNTSIKNNDSMWIKASGTWLSEATKQEIFVPVHSKKLADATVNLDQSAYNPRNFISQIYKDSKLTPSIETSVHAILDWPIVIHTHCVASIALSIQVDAEDVVNDQLSDLNVSFIPYTKPGLDLARAIANKVLPSTRVIMLGNHGIIVVGHTVSETYALLFEVQKRIEPNQRVTHNPLPITLNEDHLGDDWIPAPSISAQHLAFNDRFIQLADGNSLYPDHVIFLGPGCTIAQNDETADQASKRNSTENVFRKFVIFPGIGVAIPANSDPATIALSTAFGDVISRISESATISRLTTEQENELIDWDAEKLRKQMNQTIGNSK